jgi:hypothetical protein
MKNPFFKNPFTKKTTKQIPFEFSKGELVVFKEFLRDLIPFSSQRWPDKDKRPAFEGIPDYKITGVILDNDGDNEPLTMVIAKFNNQVKIQSLGVGNMIFLKVFADIEQIFISTDKT